MFWDGFATTRASERVATAAGAGATAGAGDGGSDKAVVPCKKLNSTETDKLFRSDMGSETIGSDRLATLCVGKPLRRGSCSALRRDQFVKLEAGPKRAGPNRKDGRVTEKKKRE